jgi:hypothetical protein
MRRRTGWRRGIGCGVVLGLVGASVFWSREKSLTERATPVALSPEWSTKYKANEYTDGYQWLDNGQLLFFRERAGQIEPFRQTILPDGRQTTPVSLGLYPKYSDHFLSSPQGRYLLYYSKSPIRARRVRVVAMDSTQHTTTYDSWGSGFLITPDENALVTLLWAGKPTLYRYATHRDRAETVTLPQSTQIGHPLCFLPDGRLILLNPSRFVRPQNTQPPVLFLMDMKVPKQPLQTLPFPPPPAPEIAGFRLSPDGKRILWQTQVKEQNWMTRMMARFRPSSPRPETVPFRMTWWVSEMSGGQPRAIASEVRTGSTGFPQMRWTPDSKRLSFVRNNTLYVLPVDG